MNYSNRVFRRPLLICDARYSVCIWQPMQLRQAVIICHRGIVTCHPTGKTQSYKKRTRQACARRVQVSSRSSWRQIFLVKRANDAPIINTCHHATQQFGKSLIIKVNFI